MSAKRACLVAYDLLSLLLISACVALSLSQRAYAYVDPSVMTYTIQALAGVGVALSTVLGVALRKTRKKLFALFGIDENAKKEVEPRVHRVDADGNAAGESYEENSAEGVASGAEPKLARFGAASPSARSFGDKPSWLRRLVVSLVVVGFCGFTLGISAPFEIVAGSSGSLSFGLSDIAPVVAFGTAVAAIVLAFLVSAVPGKAFSHVVVFLFCGGLCCYVQSLFLNTGLPAADGSSIDFFGDYRDMVIVSAVVWAILLIVPPIVTRFNRARAQAIVSCLSVCLVVVQAFGVASLFLPDAEDDASVSPVEVTEDGLFEVSSENNVIVFVLDRYETAFMNQMLEEDPQLLDGFAGFTYYANNVGEMVPTLHAVPYLLTGEVPVEGEDIQEYYDNRYARSDFIEQISSAGYSVGLYSTVLGLEYLSDEEKHQDIADMTINLHEASVAVDAWGTLKAMAKCALYRDMPWALKERFWFYTDEINQKVLSYGEDGGPECSLYQLDDPRYFERLNEYGLTVEDGDYEGAFRFIHLLGAHSPYTMNAEAQYVGVGGCERSEQAEGSLYIVETYMDMLKEMGLYEDATIIVLSDHGDWVSSLENPTFAISPILLVKPSGSYEGEIEVSQAPVSHCDFHATILEAMGLDGSSYGISFGEVADSDRVRDTYMITSDGNYCIDLLKYQVSGSVLDFSNWTYTGVSWHINDAG